MNNHFYKFVIERSPDGYSYNKIICDDKGIPYDYEFIEVNPAFLEIIGMKDSDIRGKCASEIFKNNRNEDFDWIGILGEVAIHETTREFEQFIHSMHRYYRVSVYSPEKYSGIIHLVDISDQRTHLSQLSNFFSLSLNLMCIADTKGNFIKVNKTWEDILGYSIKELENRKFLDFVHPEDIDTTLEAMSKLEGQEKVLNFINRYRTRSGAYHYIEWCTQPQGKLIYAVARDITEKIDDKKNMEKIITISEEFLQLSNKAIDYKKITDYLLEISTAKYVSFNLYDEDGKTFRTVAIAGIKENIKKVTELLGFELLGKKWKHDHERAKKIETAVITYFPSIQLLVGDVFPRVIMSIVEKMFDVQSAVVVKILSGDKMLGDFTLLMATGSQLKNESYIKIFTRQVGLLLTRNKVELQFLQAKEAAEAANLSKSLFLANMSHEIRTPMNGIMGFMQLLENTQLNLEQQDFIDVMKTSSETLLAVINDILDISKIESGKYELEDISFDLRATFEAAVVPFSVKAREKGLKISLFMKPDVPQKAVGDPIKLRQVISNLVSNSLKFTENGEVLVQVEIKEHLDTAFILMIKVKDTGIGMSENAINKLFEPFSQADSSTTRKYGGTGLGLAICKRVVEMMSGDIGVESIEGEGTTFSFTLALKKCNLAENFNSVDYSCLKGKSILIVDDNDMERNIIKLYLEEAGSMVQEASSASEAMSRLTVKDGTRSDFNAVILNHQMSDMSAYDLSTALHDLPYIKEVALILLSSSAISGDAKQAKTNGFSGYLTKPYKRKELLDCIAGTIEAIKLSKIQENALVTRHTIREADFASKPKILIVEDNLINTKFISTLLLQIGLCCDVANNGLEAVEACRIREYDIVFMDCLMPVLDGYEATKQIRRIESNLKHTPIIAMTASAMAEDARKCTEAGMDDYLSKPVDINKVKEIIYKYSQKNKDNATRNPFEDVVALLMSETNFEREIAKEFLKEGFVEILRTLHIIETEVTEGNLVNALRHLHMIKGSASNLRLKDITAKIIRAEELGRNKNIETLMNIISEIKHMTQNMQGYEKEKELKSNK